MKFNYADPTGKKTIVLRDLHNTLQFSRYDFTTNPGKTKTIF